MARDNQKETLLINARAAARLCSVGRSTWQRLDSAGKVPKPVKLGRRSLWNREEIIAWVRAGCPHRHQWDNLKKSG